AFGDETRSAMVAAHDAHFTFATDLSTLPDTGFTWIPTRQPIVLEAWESAADPDPRRYTTIMNWTSYEPIRWRGELYGQKDLEFTKFLQLPSRVPRCTLEVALPSLAHAEWQHASLSGEEPTHDTQGSTT